MPRRRRIELADGIHHVTARTPSGRLLFYDDDDHQRYLQLLAREVGRRDWRVLTFCQLSNHLHVLVETPKPDLGAGFKHINEQFARHINRRHSQSGHVFGARFFSGLVRTDRHALGCLRYIARNPIEAGICSRARDWPWSAHPSLAGLTDPPPFLDVESAYRRLGATDAEARVNYLRLVAKSNAGLLAELERPQSNAWLLGAVDDFAIPVTDIAAFLRVSRTTAYNRLAAGRRTEGSVPSVRDRNEGTVPVVSAER